MNNVSFIAPVEDVANKCWLRQSFWITEPVTVSLGDLFMSLKVTGVVNIPSKEYG